jgi:hypothetical protein
MVSFFDFLWDSFKDTFCGCTDLKLLSTDIFDRKITRVQHTEAFEILK